MASPRPTAHRSFERACLEPEALGEPGSILLESQRRDPENRASYLLTGPVEVIEALRPEEVAYCLERAEGLLSRGLTLAGFISYEAGAALEPLLPARPLVGFPLLWLAAFERAAVCRGPLEAPLPSPEPSPVKGLELDMSREEYLAAVERARAYIASGDNYQTNLTCRLRFEGPEEPLAAYLRLRLAQPVPYGAFLNCGRGLQVVSQSPELFLRRRGPWLLSRPMKGTQRRGLGSAEDEALARNLRRDPKSRAENIMIVDLMRHDLGRLAEFGTVTTLDLFRVERYATLLQMTSGVRGRQRFGLGLTEILKATFPPGSVTGAPKRRTMQIIQELEPSPRKVYCGAIGIMHPGGDLTLSVAIRTLIATGGRFELGIGSGIVADSDPAAEYGETRLKSRFFFAEAREFRLLETLRHAPAEGFGHLEAHLRRMGRSARYFGFPWNRRRALSALGPAAGLAEGEWRVRLLLDRRGRFEAQWEPLKPLPAEATVLLSERRTDASEPWLYHKTTARDVYEGELAEASRLGFTEVIFRNQDGHLTEGAFTSLMVRIGGRWLTPHLSCGLLPGLWRADFSRRHRVRQARLTPADLAVAEEVLVGNSVRGGVPVRRVADASGRAIFSRRDVATRSALG
jgi:para-aminobenzoate synthetase/4-amino-4-deoxychorismate lyase